MRLQVGRIEHQPFRRVGLGRQGREDTAEHANPAPADETVVERLLVYTAQSRYLSWQILIIYRPAVVRRACRSCSGCSVRSARRISAPLSAARCQ